MAPYRISYFGQDGNLVHREQLHFRNDDDAIDWAGGREHPHRIEVHQGGRLVARVPPLRAHFLS